MEKAESNGRSGGDRRKRVSKTYERSGGEELEEERSDEKGR